MFTAFLIHLIINAFLRSKALTRNNTRLYIVCGKSSIKLYTDGLP